MGTKDLTFVQLNQLIGRKTGGISVYPLTSSVRGKEDPCCRMIVRGKAMAGHAEDLFNLFNCVLQEVQFTDQQRFKQFVCQSKARMENRLRGSGHGVAAARMDAKLNTAGWISEQMGGVRFFNSTCPFTTKWTTRLKVHGKVYTIILFRCGTSTKELFQSPFLCLVVLHLPAMNKLFLHDHLHILLLKC